MLQFSKRCLRRREGARREGGASIMAISSEMRSLDASRISTGRDHVDGRLALDSAIRYQLGDNEKEHIARPGARTAKAASQSEEPSRSIQACLAESDIFGALADDDLSRVSVQGRTMTYARGATVFRKDDPANDFMTVLCGRIRLSSASRHGREVLFDFIGPGQCFGEVALINGAIRKWDATAVKPSTIFTLRRGDVLACLEAHPEVAVRVIRLLCARLSRAIEMFEDRAQLGLPTRSARTLLWLAREYGDGTCIGLKISQSEIAGLVGATREKVNRQLCAWCRSGILALDEGHLVILDQNALRAIAQQD
jgi:CRP/FNR family cyclic AMP-dependent transcriptional regulator